MSPRSQTLSKRERQIMDVIYRLGEATVADIVDGMENAPSYNSVRVTLSILERKDFVRHRRDGRRYLYRARERADRARNSALQHLLSTFFQDSAPRVVSTLLGMKSDDLTDEELDDLAQLIEEERKRRSE